MKQLLIQGMRLNFVDSGQRGAAHLSAAQMVELTDLDGKIGNNIAQAGTTGQLPQAERNELRPARHLAQFLPLMVPFCKSFKFMSRNEF